jgi:hypothetical protein
MPKHQLDNADIDAGGLRRSRPRGPCNWVGDLLGGCSGHAPSSLLNRTDSHYPCSGFGGPVTARSRL